MRASSRAAILVAMLLPVATGCAGGNDAAVRYLDQPLVSCPPTADLGSAGPQPLDADFAPVTATLCTFQLVVQVGPRGSSVPSSEGAGSGWQWQTVRRASGPFTDLLSTLRSPPPIKSSSTICPSIAAAPLLLILTDAAEHSAIPAVRATQCNCPLPAVQKAFDGMSWTTITSR